MRLRSRSLRQERGDGGLGVRLTSGAACATARPGKQPWAGAGATAGHMGAGPGGAAVGSRRADEFEELRASFLSLPSPPLASHSLLALLPSGPPRSSSPMGEVSRPPL